MKNLSAPELREIALDLEIELKQLTRLRAEIEKVNDLIVTMPDLADVFYENQALKLHNFYNGCERIFSIIASELNGALPDGYDWHKRLLERMTLDHEGRPALISEQMARLLEKYLAFRHVVRNIYGYELESARVIQLVADHELTWRQFETDIRKFVVWLTELANQLS
jgi:hypothetical protein